MRIIKNSTLALLAAAMSVTSFVAVADSDDWRAMQKSKIDAAQAIAIAIDKVDGQPVELNFDEDDGRAYYDVEIHTNDRQYELKIDANSGSVVQSEMERDHDGTSDVGISLQEAIITAERETQAKTKNAELKNRRVRDSYYEIDTITQNTEYELKIDANDGKVLQVRRDD